MDIYLHLFISARVAIFIPKKSRWLAAVVDCHDSMLGKVSHMPFRVLIIVGPFKMVIWWKIPIFQTHPQAILLVVQPSLHFPHSFYFTSLYQIICHYIPLQHCFHAYTYLSCPFWYPFHQRIFSRSGRQRRKQGGVDEAVWCQWWWRVDQRRATRICVFWKPKIR